MIRSFSRRSRCARASDELALERVEADRLAPVERERLLAELRPRLAPVDDRELPRAVPPPRFEAPDPERLELDRAELDRPELDRPDPPLLACGMLPPSVQVGDLPHPTSVTVGVQSAAVSLQPASALRDAVRPRGRVGPSS
jgi:hypothetical protein